GRLARLGASLGRLGRAFGASGGVDALRREVREAMAPFAEEHGLSSALELAARYLTDELTQPELRFTTSAEAEELSEALLKDLDGKNVRAALEEELRSKDISLSDKRALVRAWLEAYLAAPDGVTGPSAARRGALGASIEEAAVLLLTDGQLPRQTSAAIGGVELEGLLGQHPRVTSGRLSLRLDEMLARLDAFSRERVPAYARY